MNDFVVFGHRRRLKAAGAGQQVTPKGSGAAGTILRRGPAGYDLEPTPTCLIRTALQLDSRYSPCEPIRHRHFFDWAAERPMVDLRRRWLLWGVATILPVVFAAGAVMASGLPAKPSFPPLSDRVKTHEALRLLAGLGYRPGVVDGTMAINIEGAIRDFQRSHNLPADGKMTDGLLTALREAE